MSTTKGRGPQLASAALRGAGAGALGVAVMTASEKVEQSFTHRPNSYVPGRALMTLLGRHPDDTVRSPCGTTRCTGAPGSSWEGFAASGRRSGCAVRVLTSPTPSCAWPPTRPWRTPPVSAHLLAPGLGKSRWWTCCTRPSTPSPPDCSPRGWCRHLSSPGEARPVIDPSPPPLDRRRGDKTGGRGQCWLGRRLALVSPTEAAGDLSRRPRRWGYRPSLAEASARPGGPETHDRLAQRQVQVGQVDPPAREVVVEGSEKRSSRSKACWSRSDVTRPRAWRRRESSVARAARRSGSRTGRGAYQRENDTISPATWRLASVEPSSPPLNISSR